MLRFQSWGRRFSFGPGREREWTLVFTSLLVFAIGRTDVAGAAPQSPDATSSSALQTDVPLPRQIGDDVLERFVPAHAAADDEALRGEALAWFMTAQLHYSRGESEKGLEALKKSVAKETASLTPYRALIPSLLEAGETDHAKQAALEACKRRPEGSALAQGVALFLARTNRIDEALALLNDALALISKDTAYVHYLAILREMGSFERAAGRPEKAAELYRVVFEALKTPAPRLKAEEVQDLLGDAGVTFDEFGQVFLLASLPDLALEAFDEAAKYRTSRPAIHSYNLALLFQQTKKPEQALAELDKYFAAQLQTKGREAYQLLKDVLKALGRDEELLPRLQQMAGNDPQNSALAFFLADEYLAAGQVDQAREAYLHAPGGDRDPRAVVGLTEVYRREKSYEPLFAMVSRGLQILPLPDEGEELPATVESDVRDLSSRFRRELQGITSDAETMDGLVKLARGWQQAEPSKIDFLQAYVIGKLAIDAKRTDDAIAFYKLAIGMQNTPPIQLYREIAGHLLDVERFEEAVSLLDEAIQHPALEEQRWVFQAIQCGAYEMLGQTDQALAVIQEARRQQPKNLFLQYREGWINYHAQRWQAAISLFEDVVASGSGNAAEKDLVDTCRFSLSAIYVHLGDLAHGERILEDVLKSDPDNTQANNDLGYLFADQNKNLERARHMIEKALQAEPENAAYLDSMGWLLYRLGEFNEAKAKLLKAIEKPRGQDSTIWDHLGDVYDQLGVRAEAVNSWVKAFEMETKKPNPDGKLVKALQEKIPADRLPAAAGSPSERPPT